ncbi:type I polyketide synthase [Oscillatoria salina]|uniref:type I polyketide synthase n=1 Tax=Oscillatoria salina TaxID=331517 RepID=UPI0029620AAD|nr:polyketide synthase [Oscillatoria salina]
MNNRELNNSVKGIAVIGMVGRFPGAKSVDQFWQNLCDGQESISFYTDEEMTASGVDPAWLRDPNYVKAGSVLSDIEMFDASFFDISPREAEIMDPQHRLFLECAWEALENAGYNPGGDKIWTGVYAGSNLSTYFHSNLNSSYNPIDLLSTQMQIFVGNDKDYVGTRVSYKLNLKGPSINVNTACSTSLVAVHLACRGLLNYECDLALAGGITITVPHKTGYWYQNEGITSPDGHCRAFDAQAKGTIMGNGVGIVVLKRLKDALADGDCIYATIKGSAINNDGSGKVGFTAPSVVGQAKVIAEAQVIAGVEPETITYIEAHGTGTALGDPIEISALKKVFDASTQKKNFCAIGSVKTNVGHLNSASGVTGLIKTILALKHQKIPPSLHFQQPNPEIDFDNSPFYVNTKLEEWKTNGIPRRAGVSSFGFGGTNAHVVLEEAPTRQPSGQSRPWQLLLLSAKTSSALETATANLAAHWQRHPELKLADLAYTLQVGRRAFDYRRFVLSREGEEVGKILENQEPQRVFTNYQPPGHRPVVFLFSGQGAQYVQMAAELYEVEQIFREQVDLCSLMLKPLLGVELRELLFPGSEDIAKASEQLQQTAITQPALFVIEYALAQLWMAWGVRPAAMVGHSIGEYVAATLAGVFSLADALALVAARGQLMQQLPQGSMVAVSLGEGELQPRLGKELSLAAINGPSSCVVSGPTDAIELLEKQLAGEGVACRRLHTSHAFHSQMMAPMMELFAQQVKQLRLKPPQIPYLSNLTGTWIKAEEATSASYWVSHLRGTVRFADNLQQLCQQASQILLEVGPGRTLSKLARTHPEKKPEQVVLTSLRHPQESGSDEAFLLKTLGQLWLLGVKLDWSAFFQNEQRHRIPLPTYPFERQRYWVEAKLPSLSSSSQPVRLDKKQDIADWFYIPSWKRSLIPNATFSSQEESGDEQWLVFVDGLGVGSQLANRLENRGQDVISVKVAEQFTKFSEDVYGINPQNRDDYDALLKELIALGKTPQKIAYLWSAIAPGDRQMDKYREFYSLLFLVQSLGKQKITERLQLWVVSNQIQAVNGKETLDPDRATVLGLSKVIPQEYPQIACRNIDVVLPQSGTWQEEKLLDQLLGELTTLSTNEVVAYRDRSRWVQTFEPVRLESAVAEKTPLRKQGVYLIAGGLEGMGVVLAEYLAQTVQAKLIFIEDSAFPDQEEYAQWLEKSDRQDEVSRKICTLQGLEKLGAEVLVVSADINDYEQMHQSLAPENIGQIHGVIYSPGNKSENLFSSIQEIGKTELEQILDSKCRGIVVLEKVLQERQLDFYLILSSLSSVLGGFGLAVYSAVSLFMDALAYRHNQTHSSPWLTVNWDRLQLNITKEQEAAGAELTAIAPTESIEVFKRILSLGEMTQVIVSTVALKPRRDLAFKLDPKLKSKSSSQTDSPSSYSRPNLNNSYVAPTNELEKQIAQIWQEVLGIEQVGIYDNFFELGGDSVIAIQMVSRLRATFPVDLPMRELLLQASTVANQAEIVDELLLEKIEELSEEEVELFLAN